MPAASVGANELKVRFSDVYDLAGNALDVAESVVGTTAGAANAGALKTADEEDGNQSVASNSDTGSAALSKVRTDYAVAVGVLAVLLLFLTFEYVRLRMKSTEQVVSTTGDVEYDIDCAVQRDDSDDDEHADYGPRQIGRTPKSISDV